MLVGQSNRIDNIFSPKSRLLLQSSIKSHMIVYDMAIIGTTGIQLGVVTESQEYCAKLGNTEQTHLGQQ